MSVLQCLIYTLFYEVFVALWSVVFHCIRVPHLESPGILCKFSRTPKVLENDFGPGKSWKFKLKVLESSGIRWDMDALVRMQTRNILVHTLQVFLIHSYSDKTFFLHYMWQWWTLQYGCLCCTLICRVSKCCLSLNLHIVGDYDRVLESTFGVLEKSWNLFWARQWEPWFY